jgi:hypothetical protein
VVYEWRVPFVRMKCIWTAIFGDLMEKKTNQLLNWTRTSCGPQISIMESLTLKQDINTSNFCQTHTKKKARATNLKVFSSGYLSFSIKKEV